MPADRLLGTLLRSLQTYTDRQDTPRLLGTAASLLTTLQNPLNVTLLTSQLLLAPAIWTRPEGLRTCLRCMSVFHSAASALVQQERAVNDPRPVIPQGQPQLERTIAKDDWIRSIVKGADERSPRWQHLLVLGGLLLGFGPAENEDLSTSMRGTLEAALLTATNLALEESNETEELGQHSIALVLNHCFPILSDAERGRIQYDLLLPLLMGSAMHSAEGLGSGYFLGTVDVDVHQVSAQKLDWPSVSTSFKQVQTMLTSPLVSALGPLARLIGHAAEQVKDPWLVTSALSDLEDFSRTLHMQWRHNKLSEIDASEEQLFLEDQTLRTTFPGLWKLLRSTLFAIVIILRSVIGRTLGDSALAADDVAPDLATQALQVLRSLYFISSRMGTSAFSQYTFVYLTGMDILSAYPNHAQLFLESTKPSEHGQVPAHPLDRSNDLFFLNTAEHFTLILTPETSENLLIAAAAPYLVAGGNHHLLPAFEAAHSVMLAIFSAPQNAGLTAKHLPSYVDALFQVFPASLSARQFRLAFKTLLRITTPPSMLPASQPLLPATLLELAYDRALHGSMAPLQAQPASPAEGEAPDMSPPLSEQANLILAIVDTLPSLPLELLDEWLPLSSDLLNGINDDAMRGYCKDHFWQILVGGEMNPDRSQLCVAWWTTGGGRDKILFGYEISGDKQVTEMSGALGDAERQNKL